MKTRNELQKEVNYLKSVIKDTKAGELSASMWHKFYLDKSKKLQVELEEQKQVISNLELDAAGYRLALNSFRNDVKKLENQNTEAVNAKQLAEKEIRDIKSKTIFQLIKWWWNEKRKKI